MAWDPKTFIKDTLEECAEAMPMIVRCADDPKTLESAERQLANVITELFLAFRHLSSLLVEQARDESSNT